MGLRRLVQQYPNSKNSALGEFSGATVTDTGGGVRRSAGLASEVYEIIWGQLQSMKIAPGARITVDNLVRELNVSHTPIREALGRLEADGLVERTHLVGYRAAPQLTRKQFEELCEMRLLLEPAAARKAALSINETGLASLMHLAAAMPAHAAKSKDERTRFNRFSRQDAEFHDRIIAGAGNALVQESLSRLHTHFHTFRLLSHARVTEEAQLEHEQIAKALKERDGDAAAAAMTLHIERSRERLLPFVDDAE